MDPIKLFIFLVTVHFVRTVAQIGAQEFPQGHEKRSMGGDGSPSHYFSSCPFSTMRRRNQWVMQSGVTLLQSYALIEEIQEVLLHRTYDGSSLSPILLFHFFFKDLKVSLLNKDCSQSFIWEHVEQSTCSSFTRYTKARMGQLYFHGLLHVEQLDLTCFDVSLPKGGRKLGLG